MNHRVCQWNGTKSGSEAEAKVNELKKEEAEDHQYGGQYAVPELAVHGCFDGLFAFVKVLHSHI